MRHFLATRPVATRPHSMGQPPTTAGLVASSGGPQAAVASVRRTIAGAVDLPPVAAAADQHLAATARAHEQPD
jgi:hypothetical protein